MDREPTFPPRLWMPALLLVAVVLWWTRDRDPGAEEGVAKSTPARVEPEAPDPARTEPEPPEPLPEGEWLDWPSLSTQEQIHRLERDPFLAQAVRLREEIRRDPDWGPETTCFTGARHAPYVLFRAEAVADPTLAALLREVQERDRRLARCIPDLVGPEGGARPFGLVQGPSAETGRPTSLPFLSGDAGDAIRLPAITRTSPLATEILARRWSVLVHRQRAAHLPWWLLVGAAEVCAVEDVAAVWRQGGGLDLQRLLAMQQPQDVERLAFTTGDLVQEWALHQEFRASAGSFVAWMISGADGRQEHLSRVFHEVLQELLRAPMEPESSPVDRWVRATGTGDLATLEQEWRAGFAGAPNRSPERAP